MMGPYPNPKNAPLPHNTIVDSFVDALNSAQTDAEKLTGWMAQNTGEFGKGYDANKLIGGITHTSQTPVEKAGVAINKHAETREKSESDLHKWDTTQDKAMELGVGAVEFLAITLATDGIGTLGNLARVGRIASKTPTIISRAAQTAISPPIAALSAAPNVHFDSDHNAYLDPKGFAISEAMLVGLDGLVHWPLTGMKQVRKDSLMGDIHEETKPKEDSMGEEEPTPKKEPEPEITEKEKKDLDATINPKPMTSGTISDSFELHPEIQKPFEDATRKWGYSNPTAAVALQRALLWDKGVVINGAEESIDSIAAKMKMEHYQRTLQETMDKRGLWLNHLNNKLQDELEKHSNANNKVLYELNKIDKALFRPKVLRSQGFIKEQDKRGHEFATTFGGGYRSANYNQWYRVAEESDYNVDATNKMHELANKGNKAAKIMRAIQEQNYTHMQLARDFEFHKSLRKLAAKVMHDDEIQDVYAEAKKGFPNGWRDNKKDLDAMREELEGAKTDTYQDEASKDLIKQTKKYNTKAVDDYIGCLLRNS